MIEFPQYDYKTRKKCTLDLKKEGTVLKDKVFIIQKLQIFDCKFKQ